MMRHLFSRLLEAGRNADVRANPKPAKPDTLKAINERLNEALADAPVIPEPLPPITHPDRFPAALAIVLKHEGGYVNHPKDPGGRTNLGVTQRVWEAWTGRPATEQEMRALTVEMVAPLYRKKYWEKVRAPDLAPGLDLHVFDFGVNAGPARAMRYLQMMVGTNPDGIYGPATKRALSNYLDQYTTAKAVKRYGELREGYYRQLRTFPTFGRGWLRRNREVTAAALEMAYA
jgi:lysozyme family protein